MKKYLLIFLSFLLFLPNLFNVDINGTSVYDHKEQFDPALADINSVDKLQKYVDSIAANKKFAPQSLDYVEIVGSTIQKRFYYGYSHFALNQNWIAALCGKFIKVNYACKVLPDEILKYPYAACSQQELVMMAILRNNNISYRSVIFPHHYALEVLLNDKWYYFDTDLEPRIRKEQRLADNWKNSADSLKKYYDRDYIKNLDYALGVNLPLMYGRINEIPAPHARIFNSVTGVLSKIAWCFPLLFLFYSERKPAAIENKRPI
jgi:hypothetical protein